MPLMFTDFLAVRMGGRKSVNIRAILWCSFQCSSALPNLKYNCAVLF